MSKKNKKYNGSPWHHFVQWIDGDYDPVKGKLETKISDEELMGDTRIRYVQIPKHIEEEVENNFEQALHNHLKLVHYSFRAFAAAFSIFVLVLFLWSVNAMPTFGDPNSPVNNEVSARYIENGMDETGAVNIVTGMILDYRAFDTFGESCVLFIAATCVIILLRVDKDEDPKSHAIEDMHDRNFEPKNDIILQKAAIFLVPIIILFGIYVVLNGHLSPGGGFSGGAIIGSGFILYLTAFGYEKTQRFMNEKVCKILTVCALSFYCLAKSYSFFTGANHLHSIIEPGTPGQIISAGLILPLNICVGIVVACTMYSFYSLFRKGGI